MAQPIHPSLKSSLFQPRSDQLVLDAHESDDDDIIGSYLSSNDLDQASTAWPLGNPAHEAALVLPPLHASQPLSRATSVASRSNPRLFSSFSDDLLTPMASQYNSSQSHATGVPPPPSAPASQRTVRKSISGRKLKPQSSFSNLANAAGTAAPASLPDPNLFPDPYPSGNAIFGASSSNTTPPVSLFSAGSSSARSSAYASASPASALRSSVASSDSAHNARHPHPSQQHHPSSSTRLSVGDAISGGLPHLGYPFLEQSDHPSQPQPQAPHFGQHLGSSAEPNSPLPHQVGLASTADEVVQLRDVDQLPSAVTARPAFGSRPGSRPTTMADYGAEKTRWSSSSAASQSSRRSSWGNFHLPNPRQRRQSEVGPALPDAATYEWNHPVVDERDADFVTDDDDAHEEDDADRAAAIVMAEQGNGEIVNGERKAVADLYVPSNTTHLLLGSSASPNQLPPFLVNTLHAVSHTLLVLDISANFLTALPPPLTACRNLEELNVASNPLRVLPTWLAVLTNLRVLIADSIGISTIPSTLTGAVQLHTLSVRNNRMHALPGWLCLFPALESLYLEGNPFQGPWKALVEPLIPRYLPQSAGPTGSWYPPNTPRTPNSVNSTDASEYSEEKYADATFKVPGGTFTKGHRSMSSKDFNNATPVVTAEKPGQATTLRSRAQTLDRNKEVSGETRLGARTMLQEPNSPRPHTSFSTHDSGGSRSLSRTKTAPSRRPSAANSISSLLQAPETGKPGRASPAGSLGVDNRGSTAASRSTEMLHAQPDRLTTPTGENPLERGQSPSTLRRMKSAGDVKAAAMDPSRTQESMPNANSSDYNEVGAGAPGYGKFMSVGARGPMKEEYRALTATMFESPSNPLASSQGTIRGKDKERNKWGFLKKMSKTRLRSGSIAQEEEGGRSRAVTTTGAPGGHSIGPPRAMGGMGGPSESMPLVPHTSAADTTPGVQPPLMTASQVGFRSATSLTTSAPQRRVLSKRPTDPQHQNSSYSMISTSSTIPPSTASTSSFTQSAIYPSHPSTPGFLAPPSGGGSVGGGSVSSRRSKRRSFLPLGGPAPLDIAASHGPGNVLAVDGTYGGMESPNSLGTTALASPVVESEEKQREKHQRALKSVMGYLRDMCDLSAGTSAGPAAVTAAVTSTQNQVNASPNFTQMPSPDSGPASRGPSSRAGSRRPTLASADAARTLSEFTGGNPSSSSSGSVLTRTTSFGNLLDMSSGSLNALESETATIVADESPVEEKKVKDDKGKRAMIVREIVTTERTYVKQLQELVDIYVTPAAASVTGIANVSSKETVVPANERKVVFNGLESLYQFHKESFLPSLEKAYMILESSNDADGTTSSEAAIKLAQVFVSHAAFMRMYSTYINNFDNALRRTRQWTDKSLASAVVGTGGAGAAVAGPGGSDANAQNPLSPSQRKRVKQYLKRCRAHPRHSQMNMESYLLLPVQRIPRYRLLFEELVRATPVPDSRDNLLQRALDEITALASNMNEGKRDAESRRKLVQWQGRIRGKFPSPLVQPHRRLIMDGRLQLTRVVRKIANYFEVINASGEKTLVSVECLAPEVTPRALVAILCNDLLVLCKDPSGDKDPAGPVDLWAVLRMQTVPQPASIMHGSALRLVDNKAILYFDLASTTEAATWSKAINMHIPTSSK